MGPVETMFVNGIGVGSLLLLGVCLYLLPTAFSRRRSMPPVSRPLAVEMDAQLHRRPLSRPERVGREPFRVLYDREVLDAYDEAVFEGHPPGDEITFRIVARRTGAHLSTVRAMLNAPSNKNSWWSAGEAADDSIRDGEDAD